MLVIESNSVHSGTEVLIENVCITCFTNILFATKWRVHAEKIWTRIFTISKNVNWSLIKYSITNTTYLTGTFSYFIFILFNAKIYTPICLFSFLLDSKCFFLRGSISKYSNELYLCFLAIFFVSLLLILHKHNIKCISYCSLWQFDLLCEILQISSTNDRMPLILLTSLISPYCHHIPTRKDKSFTLLFCWTTQLIQ